MDSLGRALRIARKDKGETLQDVSDKTGISRYCLHTLEKGKNVHPPPKERIRKLASHYSIDKSTLLGLAGYETGAELEEIKQLMGRASDLRSQLSSRFGSNSSETLYQALDFPGEIKYEEYRERYKRQDIANRVVSAPVKYTWSSEPYVSETAAEETAFEKEYESFADETNLYFWLRKVDLLASLGRYAVLFLGFEGSTEDVSQPVEKATRVSYINALPENKATINVWDTDPNSSRFGLPVLYQIRFNIGTHESSTRLVHWTRIIHVAENTLESEIYGIPYLEPIYNRLLGLDKLCGGSPEMFWRGARPGYTAQAMQDSIVNQNQLSSIKEELSKYINDMQRFLFVEGVDIKALAPQVVSPKDHVEVQLQMISAATGMPIRMLTGSERGELASSQDERAWLKLIEQRREAVAKELILVPLIDRLIFLGVLPRPTSGFSVTWSPLVVLEEKDKAEIGKLRTESLSKYVETQGSENIVPVDLFLKRELSYSDEEIELAREMTDQFAEPETEVESEEEE